MAVTVLTKDNFEQEAVRSDKPVLIDFWAVWCPPCMMQSPIIDSIAEERPDIKVCKVNVDEQPELAESFSVQNIPTLVIMKNGAVADVLVGLRSKEQLLSMF